MVSLVAGLKARLMARGGDDSVEIGGTPETAPTYHVAIAEPLESAWKDDQQLINQMISKLNQLCILNGIAPVTQRARSFPIDGISKVVKVK
jgi:hypothetical protein